MTRVIIWIVWLIGLLLLCVAQSRRVLLTPQLGFVASFIPQAVFLLFFVDKWDVKLSNETMLVLIGCVTLFYVVSVLCSWLYSKAHSASKQQLLRKAGILDEPIQLSRSVLIILSVLNVIVTIVWIYYIYSLAPGGSLVEKVASLAKISKFGSLEEKIRFPFILNQTKAFFDACGYMMLYFLIHGIVLGYKGNRGLLLLNLACWFIGLFTSGNRGPFVIALFVSVVLAYVIFEKSRGWAFHIRFKTLLFLLAVGILVMCALYWTLEWFGRKSNDSMVDYLGVYLAAPLKNLDTFIREGKFGSDLIHAETFRNIVNSAGRILGKPEWQMNADLPYRSVHGYGLGNVYTCFYCYLHDFGYPGVIIEVALMAAVSQIIFLKTVYGRKQPKISIVTVLYAYIYQTLLLSFFYDRFYQALFSLNILKYLLSWWLLRLIFTKVKMKGIKIVAHRNRG